MHLIDTLLTAAPLGPTADLDTFARRFAELPEDPAAAALLGGLHSSHPAWAFGAGYQAALRRLIPGHQGFGALCVTEAGGNHPRAIETTAAEGRLRGAKRFVLLGERADTLYVLGQVPSEGPRVDLRLFPVASGSPGLEFAPGHSPILPELPHCALTLDTPAPPPLPGDGWGDYVRPFRTLEDLYVVLALSGHLVRICREYALPESELEGLLPSVLALLEATRMEADSKALHRALGALLPAAVLAFGGLSWERVDPAVRSRWERDQRILGVGGAARRRRLERARIR